MILAARKNPRMEPTLRDLARHVDRHGRVLIRRVDGIVPPAALVLSVAKASEARALRRLRERFGGEILDGRWQVHGAAAESALRTLEPYLHAQRQQARLGITFRELPRRGMDRCGLQAAREVAASDMETLNLR